MARHRVCRVTWEEKRQMFTVWERLKTLLCVNLACNGKLILSLYCCTCSWSSPNSSIMCTSWPSSNNMSNFSKGTSNNLHIYGILLTPWPIILRVVACCTNSFCLRSICQLNKSPWRLLRRVRFYFTWTMMAHTFLNWKIPSTPREMLGKWCCSMNLSAEALSSSWFGHAKNIGDRRIMPRMTRWIVTFAHAFFTPKPYPVVRCTSPIMYSVTYINGNSN